MTIKTIVYNLKSIPDREVPIPQETALQAQEFVDFVLQTKQPASLVSRVMDFTYLVRPSILTNAFLMVNLKDSGEVKDIEKLSLQDKLYLDTCLFIHSYNKNSRELSDFSDSILDALKEVCEI
jgi:hypothetical protein